MAETPNARATEQTARVPWRGRVSHQRRKELHDGCRCPNGRWACRLVDLQHPSPGLSLVLTIMHISTIIYTPPTQTRDNQAHIPVCPTIPLLPNLRTTPAFNPSFPSISSSSNPRSSRSMRICRRITTSRNSLPSLFVLAAASNSASARRASSLRCCSIRTAGFVALSGKLLGRRESPACDVSVVVALLFGVTVPLTGSKVDEWESVGLGVTGPSERRAAAKSRSAASISMACVRELVVE